MPRPPKPYLASRPLRQRRSGGEYVKLCRRPRRNWSRPRPSSREHLFDSVPARPPTQTGGRVLPSLTVSELFVLFLEAVEAE